MARNLTRFAVVVLGMLFALSFAAAQSDVEGSKDPALFTRMPGWYINQYEENEFASYEFTGDKGAVVVVEGHKISMGYTWAGEKKKPSSLQVIRNYENALKKIGGSVPYRKSDDFITMKIVKNGKETWAEINSEVDAGWGGFTLTIVEKDAMVQQVTANAEALRAGIREAGHAAAVVKNLVDKYGIEAARLSPFGAGPYCPVATNLSEDGRAQNRRVELVPQ
jgi:hypothetical protein